MMVIRIAVCGRLSAEAQKVERFVEDWALERAGSDQKISHGRRAVI